MNLFNPVDWAMAPQRLAKDAVESVGSGITSAKDMINRQDISGRQFSRDQRDYNTNMANSAHQREVADLKKAGLNPVLSAGGSGAPLPNNPAPQSHVGDVIHAATSAAGMVANVPAGVMGLAKTVADIRNVNSASTLNDAKSLSENTMRAATLDNLIADKQVKIQNIRESVSRMGVQSADRQHALVQIKQMEQDMQLFRQRRDNLLADTDAKRASSGLSTANTRVASARAGHEEASLPAAQVRGEKDREIEQTSSEIAHTHMGHLLQATGDIIGTATGLSKFFPRK